MIVFGKSPSAKLLFSTWLQKIRAQMAIMPFMPRGFKLKQQSRRDWASCGYMHHSDCFASTHDKNDDLEEF